MLGVSTVEGSRMGYEVTAHLTKGLIGAGALKNLPREFGWRLYHDDNAGLSLIDVFLGPAPKYPFTVDPYSFGREDLPALASLYALMDRREIYARPVGTPLVNCALSNAIGAEVLSIRTGDDDTDHACRSTGGNMTETALMLEKGVLIWRDGKITERKKSELGIKGAKLHALAHRYAREFADGKDTFLDLGSFDCLERVPAPVASSVG